MKKFTFRLQVVLDRALKEEEVRQRELAVLNNAKLAKEREIVRKTEERQRIIAGMADLQRKDFEVWDLQRHHFHLDALAADISVLQADCRKLDEEIVGAKTRLVEAMRKRQMLEKLREKQFADYQAEFQRLELQQMEEAVLPRLARLRASEQAAYESGD